MPPLTVPFISTRENGSEEGTSTQDLILITLALSTSITLSLTPKATSLSHTRQPIFSMFVVTVALISTVFALGLSVTAMILGWTREISLDALSGVVFALATALIQLPVDTLMYGYHVFKMSSRRSLWVRPQEFRYVRFGLECKFPNKQGEVSNNWKDIFGGRCKGDECNVRMFIRCLPVKNYPWYRSIFGCSRRYPWQNFFDDVKDGSGDRKSETTQAEAQSNIASRKFRACPPHGQKKKCRLCWHGEEERQEKPQSQWHGWRVGHTENFVKLRDKDEGITAWWWDSIASATELVDNPTRYAVKDTFTMLNALALLSDIVSIGELVFEYRMSFIEYQWTSNHGIVASKTATPGIMCRKLLKQLDLESWAGQNHDMGDVVFPPRSEETHGKRQLHGILFTILAEKSGMFGKKEQDDQTHQIQSPAEQLELNAGSCNNGKTKSQSHCFADWKCQILPPYFRDERKSGQLILDEIMRAGDKTAAEFEELCRNKVDEWLMEWGCRKTTLHSEDFYDRELRNDRSSRNGPTAQEGLHGNVKAESVVLNLDDCERLQRAVAKLFQDLGTVSVAQQEIC